MEQESLSNLNLEALSINFGKEDTLKTIDLEEKFWHFPIQLTEGGSLLSPLHSMPDNPEQVSSTAFTETRVTGTTTSRLEEVQTYTGDYVPGAFGVVSVTDEFITYAISGITYVTNRETLETTYVFGVLTETEARAIPALYRLEHEHGIEVHPTKNNISFSRSPMAVLEMVYRLGSVNTLDDISDILPS